MTRCLGAVTVAVLIAVAGCKRDAAESEPKAAESPAAAADGAGSPNEQAQTDNKNVEDHSHDEVSLGSTIIGELKVELAQGHGAVEAGKECHLVVKLPYNDKGATIVRAWIGTEDRTESFVGRADYAASHDDYDLHAIAPDPLPEDVKWWIEIEAPDGSRSVGSIAPILD